MIQLKKLATGVVVVLAMFLFAFTVNNTNAGNKEAYATTTVAHKSTVKKTDLKNSGQARDFLTNKYGDEGWEAINYNKNKDYWTFVASKDSQNGLVKAGHTLYVHADGTIVY